MRRAPPAIGSTGLEPATSRAVQALLLLSYADELVKFASHMGLLCQFAQWSIAELLERLVVASDFGVQLDT